MVQPELNKLLEKTEDRYTLVMETARRARQLVDGATPLTKEVSQNAVSQAVAEIYEDKISYIKK